MDVGYTKGIVSDNSIVGCQIGITTSGDSSPLIERNLIKESNQYGLMIQTANTIATSNTITGCRIGVVFGLSYESITHYLFGAQPSISNNNIFGNIKYNFYSKAEDNLVLTNNWWGTTDSQAINQTIYDFKNDFNLGIVNFIPFLNAPNPNAPAIQAPTRTPTPSPSPSPSPSTITPTPSVTPEPEPEPFPTTFIAAVFIATVALVSVGLLVYFKKRKHSSE
jgi:hypothetical protein